MGQGVRTVHIAARVSPELADAFRRFSRKRDRPVSAELRRAMQFYMAQNDESAPQAPPSQLPPGMAADMNQPTRSPGPSLRRFTAGDGSLATLNGDGQGTRHMNLLHVCAAEHGEQHPGDEALFCFAKPDGTPDLTNGVRTSDAVKAAQTWRRLCGASRAPQRQPLASPQLVSPPPRPRAAGRTRRERRSSPTRGSHDSDDDSSSSAPPGYATGRHLTVVRVAARYSFACLPREMRS